MSYTVLLPQPILPEGYAYLREHGCEIIDGRGFTKSDIIADIRDADAMIVRTAKITSKIFDAAPRLKIIARHGAGYDMVDIEAAKRNHVLGYHRRRCQRYLGGGTDNLLYAPLLPPLQGSHEPLQGGLPLRQNGHSEN